MKVEGCSTASSKVIAKGNILLKVQSSDGTLQKTKLDDASAIKFKASLEQCSKRRRKSIN